MLCAMTLRVALVGGPMYDRLYGVFAERGIDVEVVVHADHPTLNREVATRLAAGERIDLLSTHSKYAPSQAAWLRPLEALVDTTSVADLAPRAVELCRHGGVQYCLPRLIDVRVLWARYDRLAAVPDTWAEWAASDAVFGFTGRESGLFGMFFEMVVAHGGRLFDDDLRPNLATAEARHAVELLCHLARRAPIDLPDWHYDQVDAALLDGRVDAAAAWPGGWDAIRESGLPLSPHLYPTGPARRVSYSGCHAWAIPTTCGALDEALGALHLLVGADAQAIDAEGGTMCANIAALAAVQPADPIDAERLALTRRTIDEAMITYPSLDRFPAVEDAGWSALHDALVAARHGSVDVHAVTARMQRAAEAVLTRE